MVLGDTVGFFNPKIKEVVATRPPAKISLDSLRADESHPLFRYMGRVVELPDSCWSWTGSENGKGYGEIRKGGKKLYAHRVFYEALIGKIPDELVLDHLCRFPPCVNPWHHEPVTHTINVERGLMFGPHPELRHTHCSQGHALTPGNSYIRPDGKGRNCVQCVRIRAREYQRRKRAKS